MTIAMTLHTEALPMGEHHWRVENQFYCDCCDRSIGWVDLDGDDYYRWRPVAITDALDDDGEPTSDDAYTLCRGCASVFGVRLEDAA